MSEETNIIQWILQLDVDKAETQINKMRRLIYRLLYLMKQVGLPPELEKMMQIAQRVIAALNMMKLAIYQFYVSTGPIGWALALTGIATSAIMMDSTAQMLAGY